MNLQQYKYTESNAFNQKCMDESMMIQAAKDIEVTDIDTYPMLTIGGKGFTTPMSFGKHKAELFINNIDAIKKFKQDNNAFNSLIVKAPGLTVELYLGNCDKIVKYENIIREFLKNPGFLNKK